VSIESPEDLKGLTHIGHIVAEALARLRRSVRVGVTTRELDEEAAAFLASKGARSAPIVTYQFPGTTCISVNEVAAHGIPGDAEIGPGDLVKLDISAECDGFFADSATTVAVPPVSKDRTELMSLARRALDAGINAARVGSPINRIGQAIDQVLEPKGCRAIADLPGHGVGRRLHEEPSIPQTFDRSATQLLTEGLVITIEPHVTRGAGRITEGKDGWTLSTKDRKAVALFEHTIVVRRQGPLIVTAA
jgi:methionyl aminopeptidase